MYLHYSVLPSDEQMDSEDTQTTAPVNMIGKRSGRNLPSVKRVASPFVDVEMLDVGNHMKIYKLLSLILGEVTHAIRPVIYGSLQIM